MRGLHHAQCSSVAIDDVAGARTATQHLVNLGHKKIALLSGRPDDPFGFSVPQDRRKGFMQVLAESGLEFKPTREVFGDFTMHGASRGDTRWLTKLGIQVLALTLALLT